MTIPIDVKDKTVSNTTISDNTVSDRAVTTNTVIASASQGLTSSIYTINWVFREYLNHPSNIFLYIDDLVVHDDKESSQQ